VTYFLAYYQRGEKINKGFLMNPLLTKDEDIFFIKTVLEEREKWCPNLPPP